MNKFKPSNIEKNFEKDLEKRGVLENKKENQKEEIIEILKFRLTEVGLTTSYKTKEIITDEILALFAPAIQSENCECKCQKCCKHENLVYIKEINSVKCKDCDKVFSGVVETTFISYQNSFGNEYWWWNGYQWIFSY